ncbi:MAG: amidohydrolase family protein [Candidatus Glassbacteria bacterium]|nr:amidohydrolase family protein [Candidatus Glassbacteria bacterium]
MRPTKNFIRRCLYVVFPVLSALALFGCSGPQGGGQGKAEPVQEQYLSVDELMAMPKIDAHVHLRGLLDSEVGPLLATLQKHNMRWLTISTRGMKREFLMDQIDLAAKLHAEHPEWISWATSFSLENWGAPDWESSAVELIAEGFAGGAVAVKVWKEIGMVLKDPDGSFVMIDDPRFDPVFDYIESRGKTLVAHIGEPRNCWLPLDSMTVNNDRKYFAENPQYHSYLHPEIPHYWKHVEARDRVLARHPGLRLVGCHLGSLEFDVDELARRFDKYPNFAVDLAARVCHFQVQDREKVRRFCLKYQDRILYGTDLGAGRVYMQTSIDSTITRIEETYRNDYLYFATEREMEVWEVDGKFRGLALPADVLKKIFHDNAVRWYPGI